MTQAAGCSTPPIQFILKQGDEVLTDQAGFSLVGLALAKFAKVCKVLDIIIPKRSGLSAGENRYRVCRPAMHRQVAL